MWDFHLRGEQLTKGVDTLKAFNTHSTRRGDSGLSKRALRIQREFQFLELSDGLVTDQAGIKR